ncbi:hypothetical protein EYC84_004357 [Monilinia fructicola]|uniref:Uncharacterized protein n=1 Tax=Monilinia fructicola TaxID=38448 RepID=A0A5M9K545_MONFR|nr:hypothetical protein EYC84_004357 [Monilinia fructicola]
MNHWKGSPPGGAGAQPPYPMENRMQHSSSSGNEGYWGRRLGPVHYLPCFTPLHLSLLPLRVFIVAFRCRSSTTNYV